MQDFKVSVEQSLVTQARHQPKCCECSQFLGRDVHVVRFSPFKARCSTCQGRRVKEETARLAWQAMVPNATMFPVSMRSFY